MGRRQAIGVVSIYVSIVDIAASVAARAKRLLSRPGVVTSWTEPGAARVPPTGRLIAGNPATFHA